MAGVGRTAPPGLLGFNTLGFLITGMFAYTMLCVSVGCTLPQLAGSAQAGLAAGAGAWAAAEKPAIEKATIVVTEAANLRIRFSLEFSGDYRNGRRAGMTNLELRPDDSGRAVLLGFWP